MMSIQEHIHRLENHYVFRCEAGTLKNCIEWGQLKNSAEAAERDVLALREGLKESLACLRDLHATVKGESPSLLNEDSGGDGKLDIRILGALELFSLLKAPPTEKKP